MIGTSAFVGTDWASPQRGAIVCFALVRALLAGELAFALGFVFSLLRRPEDG